MTRSGRAPTLEPTRDRAPIHPAAIVGFAVDDVRLARRRGDPAITRCTSCITSKRVSPTAAVPDYARTSCRT
jgi:hypothetical protein